MKLVKYILLLTTYIITTSCNSISEDENFFSTNISAYRDSSYIVINKLANISYYFNNCSVQSLACYKNYLFNFYDTGYCQILDLEKKMTINETKLSSSSPYNHANNVNFSESFFLDNDTLPLLYVSECTNKHSCFVERYSDNKFSLIQTIDFKDSLYERLNNDWIIDNNKYLFFFAKEDSIHGVLLKFSIPTISKAQVSLNTKDILDKYIIDFPYTFQGAYIYNDILYLPYNTIKPYKWGLILVDLTTMKLTNLDYSNYFTIEPEGISFYNNFIIINGIGENSIYSIYHIKENEASTNNEEQ